MLDSTELHNITPSHVVVVSMCEVVSKKMLMSTHISTLRFPTSFNGMTQHFAVGASRMWACTGNGSRSQVGRGRWWCRRRVKWSTWSSGIWMKGLESKLLDINGLNSTGNILKVGKDRGESWETIINVFVEQSICIGHGKIVHEGSNTIKSCEILRCAIQMSKSTTPSCNIGDNRILAQTTNQSLNVVLDQGHRTVVTTTEVL